MRESTLRLHSVRFKSGGFIRSMPSTDAADHAYARSRIAEGLQTQGAVAGFAFVAWDGAGRSTSITHVKNGSMIPTILVPDFVRNRLLAERIERWTVEGLEK